MLGCDRVSTIPHGGVHSESHDKGRGLWLGWLAGFERFLGRIPLDIWLYGANSVIEGRFVGEPFSISCFLVDSGASRGFSSG